MNEVIKQILKVAVNAPSGDNSQPWSFKITGLGFDIYNLPDRDNPIFNYGQRGSYVAHGALIQNIKILAPLYGYEAGVSLFPDKQNPDKVASVILKPQQSTTKPNPGVQYTITSRATNRKKYLAGSLTTAQKQALFSEAAVISSGKFLLLEDAQKIRAVCRAASVAERVMLEYQPLHRAFFSMLRWNKFQETKIGYGMLIDALELKQPQKIIFKWFSNWRASALLRGLGMPAFVAKENTKLYSSASAIGAIAMENTAPEQFINTGMLLQSLWLKATELKLNIQPLVGVLYLNQRMEAGQLSGLPKKLHELIAIAAKTISNCFGTANKSVITMIFRIGSGDEPSARLNKSLPDIS